MCYIFSFFYIKTQVDSLTIVIRGWSEELHGTYTRIVLVSFTNS